MSEQKRIKVIKKGQRRPERAVQKAHSTRETAREMVKTVTNWVNEFQQKRRAETAAAMESLLSDTARPNEI